MRDDLRRDLLRNLGNRLFPGGHQPEVPTRIFQGVQHPVCIVLAARKLGQDRGEPARVRFHRAAGGTARGEVRGSAKLSLDGSTGRIASRLARAVPAGATGAWAAFPSLEGPLRLRRLRRHAGPTWVIAPDGQTLETRWERLSDEKIQQRKEALFHPHRGGTKPSRRRQRIRPDIIRVAIGVAKDDKSQLIAPVRYGFRSFDRQWIIPDRG